MSQETVILARSKTDRSTWVQLTPWGSYLYESIEWTDNNVLQVTGVHARTNHTYFRLPACYGVQIKWAIKEPATPK